MASLQPFSSESYNVPTRGIAGIAQHVAVIDWVHQRQVLARLRAWHEWGEASRTSPKRFLLSKSGILQRPACPDEQELLSLAFYFFPPRAQLKVIVCDYGDGRFERFEENLGNIGSGR